MKKALLSIINCRLLQGMTTAVLLVCLAWGAALATPVKSISGNVTDANGNPVVGATVRVKSTSIGTTTDQNGNYAIRVPTANTVLTFSSIGYVTQEVYIKNRPIVNVQMAQQHNSLAEAVVVGYGTQKRANLTGSVATVDMQQIDDLPVGDLASALRGSDKLPGVHISGGESRPGNAATLTIRNPPPGGKNGGTSSPLYVIDGVVRSEADFNLLDPSQVASISIVKDATAAIYGARAAQGVVLVTTKKGKEGTPQISYSSSYGFSDAVTVPKMMNGYQLATYLNDMNFAKGLDSGNSAIYTPDELAYFKKYNYNWFDMAWKSAFTTRQSLSVSGGGKGATYFVGGSYYYGDANLKDISYRRWTFQAGSDIDIANNLTLSLGLNGTLSNDKMFFLKQGGESAERDVNNLLTTPQFVPPYINGVPVELPGGTGSQGLHFFEAQRLNNYTKSITTELNVNAKLQYNFPFLKGLQAGVVYNRNLNNFWGKQYGLYYNLYQFTMAGSHNHIYAGQITKTVQANNGNRVRINPGYTDAYQLNADLSYEKQFGKSHLSVIALLEQSESYNETVSAEKDDVADVGMDYMQAAFGAMTTDNTAAEAGTLSYAGRVNYNYDSKYILEFDWRYDGSTKFAPAYRWGFFPALSAAWILSEENFMKNVDFINFLKLRGSAGRLGRDMTSDWSWSQRYTLQEGGHGAVFGGNGDRTESIKLEAMPNPYVTWDNIDQFDVGIDAVVLNNRLSINMDGYYNHGYDLLTTLSTSAPIIAGSQMPAENYAIGNSMGYELTLEWKGKISPSMSYSITTGVGYDNSKPIKTDVAAGVKGTWDDPTGKYTRNRGTEGFVYEGMFRSQDQVDSYLKQHPGYTIFGAAPEPGMLYYKDIRGPKQADGTYAPPDGIITDDDQTFVVPKRGFNKGVSLGLTWKNLSAHIKTSFSIGSQAFITSTARKQLSSSVSGPAFWADHWAPAHTDAAYPNPYYDDDYDVLSGFWLANSSFFDIDLVDLSYNVGKNLCRRIGITSCRFYLVLTNPLQTENATLQYSQSYPVLRNASLGINLNL